MYQRCWDYCETVHCKVVTITLFGMSMATDTMFIPNKMAVVHLKLES